MQGGQRRADPEPRPGESRRLPGPGEAPRPGDSGRGETGGRARRRAARPLGDATRCERAHKGAQGGGLPPASQRALAERSEAARAWGGRPPPRGAQQRPPSWVGGGFSRGKL